MTKVLTKNGKTIDLDQFKNKPYGAFTKYVRDNIDPLYAYENDGIQMHKYKVSLCAYRCQPVYTEIEIVAPSKEIAKQNIGKRGFSDKDWVEELDWDENRYMDDEIRDIELDSIVEME